MTGHVHEKRSEAAISFSLMRPCLIPAPAKALNIKLEPLRHTRLSNACIGFEQPARQVGKDIPRGTAQDLGNR
jgi:hypothetical protein